MTLMVHNKCSNSVIVVRIELRSKLLVRMQVYVLSSYSNGHNMSSIISITEVGNGHNKAFSGAWPLLITAFAMRSHDFK